MTSISRRLIGHRDPLSHRGLPWPEKSKGLAPLCKSGLLFFWLSFAFQDVPCPEFEQLSQLIMLLQLILHELIVDVTIWKCESERVLH